MKKSQSSDYFNRLEKTLAIDDEGNATFAKSVLADGTIGGNSGLMVLHTYTWSATVDGMQWDYTIEILEETTENSLGYNMFAGYLRTNLPSIGISQDYKIVGDYRLDNGQILELSGVTFGSFVSQGIINGAKLQLFTYDASTQTVAFKDYALADNTQPKLFKHTLILTADSKSYTLIYPSTNNLKVDSIADLRTIANVKATSDNVILPVCLTDLTGTAVLQITTALCKVGTANVTAVSDEVTL